ncbi:MAG: bifunctional glutamate N-acetyltransferase/amino-acid acetyltransferase ArgJ [Pseudolactococcus laudensis]
MNKYYDIPNGFHFLGKHVGIKKVKKDLGIIFSDKKCISAAMFTKNQFCGESIPIGKAAVSDHILQAVVVTSGIANVATGTEGYENAKKIVNKLSKELEISPADILPSSTGIIGPQLPLEKIIDGMSDVSESLSDSNLLDFANAIMTTDKKLKIVSRKVGESSILGIAKGSGMIEPNMATMLVYILTEAIIPENKIDELLSRSVSESFNSISVDTDTSTSDTVALMANNSIAVDLAEFSETLSELCLELAKSVLEDAEGAEHLIEVEISKCVSKQEAKKIGKSIVNSPLVKTAVYGGDPNWGRIVMAIGKTSDILLSKKDIIIYFGSHKIFESEKEIVENIGKIRLYLKQEKYIKIKVEMNTGELNHKVYGCDLTESYIEINSYYQT